MRIRPFIFSLLCTSLLASGAIAEDNASNNSGAATTSNNAANNSGSSTESTTIKVQNGVTVKTGGKSLAPEKKQADRREDSSTATLPSTSVTSTNNSGNSTASKDAEKPSEPVKTENSKPENDKSDTNKPAPAKTTMKPVVDKDADKHPLKKPNKHEAAKTVDPKASPFKKSQDAGVKEVVKRPDPKPEVTSKPLPSPDSKNSISGEIKNIEDMKKISKATNAEDGIGESGLPIPRFVSLKSGEANARTGPGDSYPIRWVYQRKNLPVEVTAEFKLWRRIKDFDGEQTWVHQALLSSRRYAIVSHDATVQSGMDEGTNLARFKRGVQVRINECKADFCRVEYGNIEGWLKKKDLWGIYDKEVGEFK